MRPLSLYTVTFNCARQPIDPEALKRYLFQGIPTRNPPKQSAGRSGQTNLRDHAEARIQLDADADADADDDDDSPDLIFLSLQEFAPIGPAFLGGWSFLAPYLNLAILAVKYAVRRRFGRVLDRRRRRMNRTRREGQKEEQYYCEDSLYRLAVVRHVGMIAVMVFVKRDDEAEDVLRAATRQRGVRGYGTVAASAADRSGSDRGERGRRRGGRVVKITDLWEAGVGCGSYGRVGNKGAVAVRLGLEIVEWARKGSGPDGGFEISQCSAQAAASAREPGKAQLADMTRAQTQVTVVSSHLAPHEYAVERRNEDWEDIVRGLVFTRVLAGQGFKGQIEGAGGTDMQKLGLRSLSMMDKKGIPTRTSLWNMPLGSVSASSSEDESYNSSSDDNYYNSASEGEDRQRGKSSNIAKNTTDEEATRPLLARSPSNLRATNENKKSGRKPARRPVRPSRHSIYSQKSHLIVAGDLNYRTASVRPDKKRHKERVESSEHYKEELSLKSLLADDQLGRERNAGRTLQGLYEADIRFAPSYKLLTSRDLLKQNKGRFGLLWDVDGFGKMGTSHSGKDDDDDDDGGVDGHDSHETIAEPDLQVDSNTRTARLDLRYNSARFPSWCDRILFSPGVKPNGYVALPVRATDGSPLEASFPTWSDSIIKTYAASHMFWTDSEDYLIMWAARQKHGSDHRAVCLSAYISLDDDDDDDDEPGAVMGNDTSDTDGDKSITMTKTKTKTKVKMKTKTKTETKTETKTKMTTKKEQRKTKASTSITPHHLTFHLRPHRTWRLRRILACCLEQAVGFAAVVLLGSGCEQAKPRLWRDSFWLAVALCVLAAALWCVHGAVGEL